MVRQVWRIALTVLLLRGIVALAGSPLKVSVQDQSNQPAAAVTVQVLRGTEVVAFSETDQTGAVAFPELAPGHYSLTATKQGFEQARSEFDIGESGAFAIELTLVPALARHDRIDVHDTVTPLDAGASPPSSVAPQLARDLPSRPSTVADVLPLVPGVVRSTAGGLQISGAGEHRGALIVNSADVTDPATGQFGLTVPVDVVENLTVYQTPFLAQYGRFTAGLVSVETRRGGDQWKWELNDPFPDFRIRSYHMHGIKDATPRVNFGGPLIPGKLYFTEGFEYAIRKIEVYTLAWPNNQQKQEGLNSFAQLDWIASARQLVTASLHIAPQKLQFANISFLNPEPASPDAAMHNYTATVSDRLTLGSALWENTLSATRFDANVWPQGPLGLTMAPWGNTGNYFEQQNRIASRAAWSSTYSFPQVNRGGSHNFKVGSYIAGSADRGQVNERPIDLLNGSGSLIERISFSGGRPYNQADTEFAFFGQDHWIVSPRVAVDLGIRTESQEVSESFRVAPRAGVAWTPFANAGTTFRAGFGLFYDRVPLNVYSFADYPNATVAMLDGFGSALGGPYLFQNVIGEASMRYPFVIQGQTAGNFSPHSSTWRFEVEQPINRSFRLRAGYMQNDSSGLVILNKAEPDPLTNVGAYQLSGSGRSRYRQFEVTGSLRLKETSQLFFSYVRSSARGDLNDFANFLGTFPVPLLRPDQFSTLPTDLPNRFLVWGNLRLRHGFRVAPVLEYRTGFPYAVTDALQNYVGVPYQNRFPSFFSADARVSKDFKVNPKYTIRISVAGFNLTDHFNPEAIHTNIDDPAYGAFVGQHGRRYTADFDVLF
jgi:carboxypeptidase family protein